MAARILDGKQLAQQIRSELAEEVIEFIQNNAVVPCLAAVLVGEDPASEVYVRNKRKACEAVGIESQLHRMSADTSSDDLLKLIAKLNKDGEVHGILVQLPLTPQIDKNRVLLAVSPVKDVDSFHPENVGRLVQGRPRFLPCTPQAVQQLLHTLRGARQKPRPPLHQPPNVLRMKRIDVLHRTNRQQHSILINLRRQWQLHQNAVDLAVLIQFRD